jgi:hypothetical protein
VLAEMRGHDPNLLVQLLDLRRDSAGAATLRFVLHNTATGGAPLPIDRSLGEGRSVDGVYLLDPAGQKKYFVLRDANDKPQCTTGLSPLPAGDSVVAWVKFPAPPGEVKALTVVIPAAPPIEETPIF